jgi:hypothetical protein
MAAPTLMRLPGTALGPTIVATSMGTSLWT